MLKDNVIMNTKNMFIIFILNIAFAILEGVGGIYTGSFAIISDAIHDFGDALSIGCAYLMERLAAKKENEQFSYGYSRFSILSSVIITLILIIGAISSFVGAVHRLIMPVPVNYTGMFVIACIGVVTNLVAYFLIHGFNSLNQKALRLHLLEDVLGWVMVLVGAILMKYTNWYWIDAIVSMIISIIILVAAISLFVQSMNVFLLKTPSKINISTIKSSLVIVPGIDDVHSIRVLALDDKNVVISMHVVAKYHPVLKRIIKNTLQRQGIYNSNIEFELPTEKCNDMLVLKKDCDCC